jgi:hypothetical protein
MFDFSKVSAIPKVDKDFVLSRLTDSMIFGFYHGPFELKKSYPSKFRREKHNSCGFYVSPKGKLIYKDIARNEKLDCFDFVQKLYGLTFQQAIERVAMDFGLIDGKPHETAKKVMHDLKDFDKTVKKETRINFKAGKWTTENLAYWNNYSITKEELKENNIYPIEKLFINGAHIRNLDNEIRYALTLMHEGEMLTKLYIPESKNDFKWVTNIPTAVPFGMDTLNLKSDFVFVAKSQKCRIVLKKFLPNVIAIQSEQPAAISKSVHSRLQFDYDRIYLGADNDDTGKKFMAEMEPKGYIPMPLPDGDQKDYSDLAYYSGLATVKRFLQKQKLI